MIRDLTSWVPSFSFVMLILSMTGCAQTLSPDQHHEACDLTVVTEPAIDSCTWLLESTELTDDSRVRVHTRRAEAHAWQDDYDKAVSDYSKAILLDRKNGEALSGRGKAYLKLQNYGSAIDDLNLAIELGVKEVNGFLALSMAYSEVDDLDSSILTLRQGVRDFPDEGILHFLQGANLYIRFAKELRSDDLEMASLRLSDAIRVDSEEELYGLAHYMRGFVHLFQSDLDSAIADFDKAILIEPLLRQGTAPRKLQTMLKEEGCYNGPIDGVFETELVRNLYTCFSFGDMNLRNLPIPSL